MNQVSDPPLHRQLGLTDDEYTQIGALMGRAPNHFELAVFSLLWSEHCGYKHSRMVLRRLPTDGPAVLQGPGENAGVVDAGDGLGVAFKVESHNHPSAVEPFQGAATGVGGILRDVFAMGARPIAILDSLRFGDPATERTRRLFDGAVRGIGHYGNCVGVANIGGEVRFDPGYEQSCLVNAMCIGVLRAEDLKSATAAGTGNLIVLFGARTGRDGIGGASVLASQDIDAGGDDKRPTVQIGDPYMEKRLIEASLELIAGDVLVGLQDLGAAGLASSASEMASRGPVGVRLDLAKVPLREADMEPFEIMISESQERMLACVEPSQLAAVQALCARWELQCSVIGEVIEGDHLVCTFGDEVVGDIPVSALVDDCPRYALDPVRPARLADEPLDPAGLGPAPDPTDALKHLLVAPNVASKAAVYQQYDQLVGGGGVIRPGADAGVVRLPGSQRAVAAALDGSGRRTWLDPRRGGRQAVAEAARNVACTGARPLAITNCLNFGNPERGETPYMLVEAVEGMAEACEAIGAPVVSGNVSLYNEHAGGPIPPTPIVGCVGLLDDAAHAVGAAPRDGTAIVLLGDSAPAVDGSEYQAVVLGAVAGRIPDVDLAAEAALLGVLHAAAAQGLMQAAHDVADGGLAVCAAELAIAGRVGIDVELPALGARDDITLFGEPGGGLVLAATPDPEGLIALAAGRGVPARAVGRAGGHAVRVRAGDATAELDLADAIHLHGQTIPQMLGDA
ncbi:MAG: phosphoribosylformylglycinamidine synthase subunit PurL [Actinobacteria bacterium]|nr:phosphoribosylformylglycinamidine synthase subunit PurL [Actinomycetota bacterium]